MGFEIDIKTYASILLALRIVSMWYMGKVLHRQTKLFKRALPPVIADFRKTLFTLAVLIMLGNFIPTIIDLMTLTGIGLQRTATTVGLISITYTLNVSLVALLSAYTIWRMYKLALKTDLLHQTQSDHTLMTNETEVEKEQLNGTDTP